MLIKEIADFYDGINNRWFIWVYKIKNENKQLNKAKDIFASQITSICEDFKICLERVI